MDLKQALSQKILFKLCVSSVITLGLYFYFLNDDVSKFKDSDSKEVFKDAQHKLTSITSQLYILKKTAQLYPNLLDLPLSLISQFNEIVLCMKTP